MKRKPRILIHESVTGHGLMVAQCLAAARIFHIEVASEQAASATQFSRRVARHHSLSAPATSPEGLNELKRIISERKIDVLLPINPLEIPSVMEANSELHSLVRIPTQPTAEAYHNAGNKAELSLFLEEHDIAHPRTRRYDTDRESFVAVIEKLRIPLIAKPTSSGGGNGVRRFDDRLTLMSYLDANADQNNPYIVQEFIQGRDYGCGVWCSEGEVLYHTLYKRCHTDGHSLGPFRGLIFLDNLAVMTVVKKLMKELRWNGIAQIDLRVNEEKGEVFIIEVNPRVWATITGSMRRGINFPELACRQALGLPLPPVQQKPGRYMTRAGSISYVKRALRNQAKREFPGLKSNGLYEIISDPLPVVLELGGKISKRRAEKA